VECLLLFSTTPPCIARNSQGADRARDADHVAREQVGRLHAVPAAAAVH